MVADIMVRNALSGFAERMAAREAPQLLLRMTVGAGKTRSAIEALPDLLTAARAAGRRGPALFAHPRHALGDQIAADIRERHPYLHVAIWRGQEADNPDRPGKTMCEDLALVRAAKEAAFPPTHPCGVCALQAGCAYIQQAAVDQVDVWVAPQQVLFHRPFRGWPRVNSGNGSSVPLTPAVVILDEGVAQAGLRGVEAPLQLSLARMASQETPNLTGERRDNLLVFRQQAFGALMDQPAGHVFRDPLVQAGFQDVTGFLGIVTASPTKEWAALEWDCHPQLDLSKGTDRAAVIAAYKEAKQDFTALRPRLALLIGAFLRSGDTRSINIEFVPEANLGKEQGTGPAVRLAWREDIDCAWTAAPMLFLDATGRAEVLRHWAPALEVLDVEVKAPHQHVVQVVDRTFSRTMLTTPEKADRLADVLMVELAQAAGPVLAVCQLAVETLLRERVKAHGGVEQDAGHYVFPSGAVLHLAHHGAVTGVNTWQRVATVVVIGQPATNRLDGERVAEVIAGRAVDRVADDGSLWPTVRAGVRMTDGTGRRIERQSCHPDPLVEAWRWTITEGAALQALGRGAGCSGARLRRSGWCCWHRWHYR
jgi:putative DNA primase/helicase